MNTQTVYASIANSKAETFKMALESPGLIEDLIIKQGTWEPYISLLLSRLITDNGVFLDIGANIGYHSLYIASSFPNVTCIAFEPHPVIFQQFQRNIIINQFRNVVPHHAGVAETSGSLEIFMQTGNNYNRALSSVYNNKFLGDVYKQRVSVVALDQFLIENTKRNVSAIKIDTQGYEYQVLKGALDIIEKSQPVVAFEYHHNNNIQLNEILKLLPNYKVYKVHAWSGETRKLEDKDPHNFTNDYICLPKRMANVNLEKIKL